MSKFISRVLVIALLVPAAPAFTAEDKAPEIPAELVPALVRAERLGHALAEAMPSATPASKDVLKQAKKQGAQLCSFDYKLVVVQDEGVERQYLVATTKRKTDIIVGRHFQLTDTGAQASSNTCLNTGTPPQKNGQKLVATTVTHLLSPAPNEFHVYLSLVQSVPLLVIARSGIWLVAEGHIAFMQPPPDASASGGGDDQGHGATQQQLDAMNAAIAPYVAQAKETYSAAKARYLEGLPARNTFYVTTRLRDRNGRIEQVFIRVTGIKDQIITGQIANDLNLVTGFRRGQSHSFPESEMLDWVIVRPDGSEEGNVVGKFLDTYQP